MNDERMAAASDQDARLMLAFREGSLEAFEELFSRHARAMVSFAYRFVRDRAVAEELAQEVFLRVSLQIFASAEDLPGTRSNPC